MIHHLHSILTDCSHTSSWPLLVLFSGLMNTVQLSSISRGAAATNQAAAACTRPPRTVFHSPVSTSPRLAPARAQMTAAAKTEPSEEVLDVWRTAEAVCFDVDSTFCEDESIDEIAAFLGVGEQVAALTAQAMGGSVLFQDALASRLNIMGLSQQRLNDFLKAHPALVTPGIPELVAKLQAQGKAVFLVSGGFRQVIHPIAESLNIPISNVFANRLMFKDDGSYAGFDAEEFTSRSGGKAEAVRYIKKVHGYSRVVMVGDGATDLEARTPDAANIFIGYGGVVERPNIAAQADWYIYKIQPLIDALN